jgi:hypothetical protein
MNFLRRSLATLLILACLGLLPQAARAQTISPALEPRQAIGTILMSGLVGGILGLSTLSFYTRPQDNIRNISIGAGVGIIASSLYLTYSVADEGTPRSSSALLPHFDGESGGLAYALSF